MFQNTDHQSHACSRRSPRRAFTLVELLVVIGIIAVLVSILLPVLRTVRESAKRVICAAHLKNAGNAMLNYATDYNGQLPQQNGATSWLWDLPLATRDALVKAGMNRDSFYCPSRDIDPKESDLLWTFYDAPVYCVTGYFWLTKRPVGGPFLNLPKVYFDTVRVPNATNLELVTDATISSNPAGPFSGTIGGFGPWTVILQTNHLRPADATQAAGGNILFLDGHVTWRNFSEMHIWATPNGTYQWF